MSTAPWWPWVALLLLGTFHGINPAMGWLFAVALGLQEQNRRAVWRALLPLAAGHALAIGGTIAIAVLAGLVVPLDQLKWIVAVALVGTGLYRLIRQRHPRWGGMRMKVWELCVWSLLMASAHGAGLMVLPLALESTPSSGKLDHLNSAAGAPNDDLVAAVPVESTVAQSAVEPGHAVHATAVVRSFSSAQLAGLGATLIHTVGYLLVTGLVAVIVYEKLGLRLLRKMWINVDILWGAALVLTGVLTPLF